MSDSNSKRRRPSGWALYLIGALIIVAAGLLLNKLLKAQRYRLLADVQARTDAVNAGPRVAVVRVSETSPFRTITLLGEAHPYQSVTLYAKVSGYLREIRVDKGDRVQANQVLAVIESPETDKQYEAALADAKNKRINAERARSLVKRDMIAQQEADQAETDAQVADANVAALATMKSYEVLRAPFDGTVTARYADPGALLQNAANSQTSAQPLVMVSQTSPLRVYVYPDQRDAVFIHPGTPVIISLPDRPEAAVAASVTRLSGQLDPKTRTMLTEIDCDNEKGTILAGSFVQVTLRVRTRGAGGLELPAEALVLRGNKPFVAVVTAGNRVNYRPVTLGDYDGEKAHVLSGLKPGERVALNLGDRVAEGSAVRPVGGQ